MYMINFLFIFGEWTHLVLRLIVALIFIAHGWPKIKDLKTTADNFDAMGFRPGKLWGTYAAILEVVGGGLMFLGAGVQILSILFAGEMIVTTIWKLKNGQKLVNGYELDLLLLAAALALATWGGGILAFDNSFRIF